MSKIKQDTYLCKEHDEEFTVRANSIEHAQELAEEWGGVAICKVKVISRRGNFVEFEKPF